LPTLRLFSLIACDSQGRSYLSPSQDLLKILLSYLEPMVMKTVSLTEQVAVGNRSLSILQSLSLKKIAQDLMIRENLIEKIFDILRDYKTLSPFNLDYYTALLMNLCLRKEGIERFDNLGENVLDIVKGLLSMGGGNVRTFINGVLYSVLKGKKVKKNDWVVEIVEFLKDLRNNGTPEGAIV
jgi:LisH domain-containing protein ARMC9